MPSLTATSGDAEAASTTGASTPPPLSRCGASEEHLSMEHVVIYTAPEVFAKKPLQRVTSSGEELDLTTAGECNNGTNVDLPFTLLPGEYARWYSTLSSGVLITLTNFRLFVLLRGGSGFYNIPIQCIDAVECRDMFYLHVACKDGRIAKFTFENNESCLSWWRLLNAAIAPPSKLEDIFAFAFYAWCKEEKSEDGLCLRKTDVYLPVEFDPKGFQVDDDKLFTELEFSRLEFDPSMWRITELNKDYRFCSTYPKYWIVPASVTDSEIESAGRYRSMRRVPAVVWRHRVNGAVLVRCSQPESGIFGWRSPADETLLNAIASCCGRQKGTTDNAVPAGGGAACSAAAPSFTVGAEAQDIPAEIAPSPVLPPNAKNMLILDARSYTAAWANRAKGGGFESTEYYQKCEIQFLGLANIHSIRYSFQKLRTLCWESAETNWFQSLDACQWIYHLWALLASAVRVVEALHIDGRPVLIHCSDGWDRTTQIVALAKLFLDPHYRTMKGFKELIEREWIAFGHKFAERSGTTVGDVNQRAPVFLQWLDCVHYVLKENPCAFEFNEAYLVKLAQHVYSGLFGTFLCNSVADYVSANVASRTYSIWSYLHPANRQFRNVFYTNGSSKPILPRFQQRDLAEIWRTVYCPPSDPANLRPRSFSTASIDGDTASFTRTAPANMSTSNDRMLSRAHSCDNLVTSTSPPSTSIDNLPSLTTDKAQCSLHRTGSDSSLTKMAGNNVSNGLYPSTAVERDTEEVLRSLVETVEKHARTSRDFDMELIMKERMDLPPDPNRSTADGPASGIVELTSDQAVHFIKEQPVPRDMENWKLDGSRPATEAVNEANRGGTDISTSTTDLNHCCGNVPPTNGYRCRHLNGFLCDLNDNCTVLTNACSGRMVTNGGRASVGVDCALSNSVSPALGQPNATPPRPNAQRKGGRPMPKDLIDSDGMTKIMDAPQQRVREIINNYERQMENLTVELEQLHALMRLQHQNGHNCFCNDRKKHLSVDDGTDVVEPHSFGSHGNASEASWDAVEEREAQPVLWMPDHASNRCMRCDSVFTIINRRHHCRCCGKLFCNACSSYESAVPEEQLYDLVRVCGWCYASLRQQDSPSQPIRQPQIQTTTNCEREQLAAKQQQQQQQQQQPAQHTIQQATRSTQHQVLPQQKVSA